MTVSKTKCKMGWESNATDILTLIGQKILIHDEVSVAGLPSYLIHLFQ
jgi:hypothetical protein